MHILAKFKAIPRYYYEVIITILAYILFWTLFKDSLIISDQGLTTIGMALSTSLGVLTAIVVSFILITWQSSRQERSSSYWRWKNSLTNLFDVFDANVERMNEIAQDIYTITTEAAAAAIIHPMPRDRLKELIPSTLDKIGNILNRMRKNAETSDEDVQTGRAYHDVHTCLVNLATANL